MLLREKDPKKKWDAYFNWYAEASKRLQESKITFIISKRLTIKTIKTKTPRPPSLHLPKEPFPQLRDFLENCYIIFLNNQGETKIKINGVM